MTKFLEFVHYQDGLAGIRTLALLPVALLLVAFLAIREFGQIHKV